MNVNNVTLAGRLTGEVQLNKGVASFGLAINSYFRNKEGEKKEEVTFVDIVAFDRTAENCAKFLDKGSQALVEGRLKLETWQTKDGHNRSKLRVIAKNVQFIFGDKKEDKPKQDSYKQEEVPF